MSAADDRVGSRATGWPSFAHFGGEFDQCCGKVSSILGGQLDGVVTCGRAEHDRLIAFEPECNICGNATRWKRVGGISHGVIMPAFPLGIGNHLNARQAACPDVSGSRYS